MADPETAERTKPGRKRSEATRLAILGAAYRLVSERGYSAVTMDDIVAEAGAGKRTVYRWWPSKPAVILDALEQFGALDIDPEPPEDSSLVGFFDRLCKGASRTAPVLRSLMAEAQFDPPIRAELRRRLIDRRRHSLRRALARWGVKDETRRESLVLALNGALWYRLLLDEPLDEPFAREMAALAKPYRPL